MEGRRSRSKIGHDRSCCKLQQEGVLDFSRTEYTRGTGNSGDHQPGDNYARFFHHRTRSRTFPPGRAVGIAGRCRRYRRRERWRRWDPIVRTGSGHVPDPPCDVPPIVVVPPQACRIGCRDGHRQGAIVGVQFRERRRIRKRWRRRRRRRFPVRPVVGRGVPVPAGGGAASAGRG